jgi:outer membrane biosynthesis protein TonB
MVVIYAQVHPLGPVTAEPIAIDIVSPEEAAPPPGKVEPPKPQRSDAFDLSAREKASSPPEPAAEPQQQAALSTPPAVRQPQPGSQSPPSASQVSRFVPPEPDLSIKYHVLPGLPPELPRDISGDDFDAPASKPADIDTSLVTEFRRHLKKCSKLPESIARSDKLKVTLRVRMTREGRLAAEPILIEATASAKGPVLMKGAMAALQACQPYAMLPADRYGEWHVLDVSFTPQDFAT